MVMSEMFTIVARITKQKLSVCLIISMLRKKQSYYISSYIFNVFIYFFVFSICQLYLLKKEINKWKNKHLLYKWQRFFVCSQKTE